MSIGCFKPPFMQKSPSKKPAFSWIAGLLTDQGLTMKQTPHLWRTASRKISFPFYSLKPLNGTGAYTIGPES